MLSVQLYEYITSLLLHFEVASILCYISSTFNALSTHLHVFSSFPAPSAECFRLIEGVKEGRRNRQNERILGEKV